MLITNSSSKNAYVYFKNTKKAKNSFAVYLKKGGKTEFKAPYGNYEIYFATGDTFYGRKWVFGHSRQHYKNNGIAKLYRKGNVIYGVRYKIYNLKKNSKSSSNTIPGTSFPK